MRWWPIHIARLTWDGTRRYLCQPANARQISLLIISAQKSNSRRTEREAADVDACADNWNYFAHLVKRLPLWALSEILNFRRFSMHEETCYHHQKLLIRSPSFWLGNGIQSENSVLFVHLLLDVYAKPSDNSLSTRSSSSGCLHSVHTTMAKLCSTPGQCPGGLRATFQKVHWQSYVGQGPFWAAWVPRASTYQTSSLQIFSVFFITLSLSTSSPDSGMLAFCSVVIKTTLFLLLFFCCLHSRNKQGRGKRHKTELRKEWPGKGLV